MNFRLKFLISGLLILAWLITPHLVVAQRRSAQFDAVAKIIQRRCIECHRETNAKGGISFEKADESQLDDIIDSDNPSESRLIEVITPDAFGSAEMPKNRTALSKSEIEKFEKWIASGAPWPKGQTINPEANIDLNWWALKPVKKVQLPVVPSGVKLTHPIDKFVFKKLQQHQLRFSKPASKRTLIRRLYYDLVGLPPTPQQIEKFEKDVSPDAYEKLVDRLLASPRYGERWARHWLDVVHYGDTHGFDKDKLRPHAWRYRDWVIRSFNDDKNYTRFVREQIAGDVLWPKNENATIATGMIVAGPFDWVGQIEVAEGTIEKKRVRNIDRDDMVATVMNALTSTTVQCARCHDHKFDPVKQSDYYALQSVFAGIDRADRQLPPNASTIAAKKKYDEQRAKNNAQLKKLQKQLAEKLKPHLAPIADQIAATHRQLSQLPGPFQKTSKPHRSSNGYHSQFAKKSESKKWVELTFPSRQLLHAIVIYPARPVDFPDTPGFAFPKRWILEAFDESSKSYTIVAHQKSDFANPGDNPVVIQIPQRLRDQPLGRIRFTANQLATRSAKDNMYALALSEIHVFSHENENIAATSTVTASDSINTGLWHTKNLTDNKTSRQKFGEPAQLKKFSVGLKQFTKLNAALTKLQQKRQHVESTHGVEIRQQIALLEKQNQALEKKYQSSINNRLTFAVASEFRRQGQFVPTHGKPRPIYLLHRGDEKSPDKKRGLVAPGAMNALENLRHHFKLKSDHTEGDRRVALANWIVDKQNPLTWRSIVNRVWQHHFGQGLVATSNDFGRMGSRPTHPELLDYLALQFRDNGQSLKQLHRLIVTSRTYRQSSQHNAKFAAIDSGNQFLWRMNRRRLDAEQVRDSILAITGKLDTKMYGSGYRMFAFKDDHSPHYDYLKFDPQDPTTYRRSIYRFIVRSAPDPFFTSLDCADPSQIVARRNETNTALQALTMLNNRFTTTMSQLMAQQIEKAQLNSTREKIAAAVHQILGRTPAESEIKLLVEVAQQHSLTNVCRILFNTNEFMFVD